jgi:hypothetical protein
MEKTFKQKNFNNFVWTPVSTTLAKMVEKFATGVADTGGKFASGVVDTGGNFAAGVVAFVIQLTYI